MPADRLPSRRSQRERLDREPKRSVWQRMPAHRRWLLILLALGVVAATFRAEIGALIHELLPRTATVRLIDIDDRAIQPVGRADVFELDRTLYMPSPGPLLGSVPLDGASGVLTLDSSRFPKSLQVRFHVEGYGVDYQSVELGHRREFRLRLGPPVRVSGLVTDQHGELLPGARVLALGMHERGVLLAEATTNERGEYVLDGISQCVGSLVLRVLKEGFSMQEREHVLIETAAPRVRNTEFKLTPVPPVVGRVLAPPACGLAGVRVSVMNVPGVCAEVAADGAFTLHHLAADQRYRLLLRGLPAGFGQTETLCRPGERVEIDVMPGADVEGTVISKSSGRAVAAARISHTFSTKGVEVAVTDALGRFVLPGVPVGELPVRIEVPESPFYPGGVEERTIAVAAGGGEPVRIEVR